MSRDDRIQSNINEYGWHFLFVFDSEGDNEDFAYSVGFEETFNHPEIMIFGFDKDAAHAVLSNIASDLKEGLRYATDKRFNGVLGNNYTVMFKQVMAEAFEEYLGTAVAFYQKPFRAWVMFWPDKKDVFPFENGCELTAQNEALSVIQ